jgi:hypothetical protein
MAKPAAVAALPKAEPKVEEREPDWTKPIELKGWWLPYLIATTASSSFQVGSYLSTGTEVQGIVERILLMPTGVACVAVRQVAGATQAGLRWVVFREGHGVVA